mmetsp:Transcript_16411/g.44859  ORF Transcript_16411/g.44859 Transcript_16411/m.44859 type:complete len:82 (+) Transcript_16411:627-872(+)
MYFKQKFSTEKLQNASQSRLDLGPTLAAFETPSITSKVTPRLAETRTQQPQKFFWRGWQLATHCHIQVTISNATSHNTLQK